LLARFEGEVWGRLVPDAGATAGTKQRYARQWDDPDTGLFYNLYRHYDPDCGRYISPEPLGLEGGIRPFGYAFSNPLGFIDPNGLEGMTSTATDGTTTVTATTATEAGTTGPDRYPGLHPAVQQCLLPPGASQEAGQNGNRSPATCAEPQAVSDYLDRTVGRAATHAQVSAALSRMQIEAHQTNNDRPRAPCANCSQFFARLQTEYGAPAPSQIAPGYRTAGRTLPNGQPAADHVDPVNFTPPTRPRLQQGAGAGAYPIMGQYPVGG
jgi:RHS repeat-associated protein